MRYLLISFFFLGLGSCSLKTTKDLLGVDLSKSIVKNPYFSDIKKDYVYKAKIEVYGNNFGGILIVKKQSEGIHRVVFTTEFGNKLFDFLYEEDNFTVNYIVKELDKKMIVNTFQKDFKLLISEQQNVVNQYQSKNFEVYKTANLNRNNFYFYNKKSATLDKIVSTSKRKEKVIILFDNSKDNNANLIVINHKNINLNIELVKFKK
ncbi:MAG: hypothetical protein L3J09_00485 [Flavobacteriaceae bacterium]|nr:hypothetical protein [Flavobacteriaceae bacterium]